MGTGHYQDSPEVIDGVSWRYRTSSGSSAWALSSFNNNVTASYPTLQPGGGTWYTDVFSTQSFTYATSKDINLDVTNIVNSFSSASIENNGFIIKKDDSIEFSSGDAFD
jgi:hypothetical protein